MTITLVHADDPDLEATLTAPSEDAWEAWFNESPSSSFTAKYNLLFACRSAPSEAELTSTVRDWSGLPEAAYPHLFLLAGAPITVPEGQALEEGSGFNAEKINLRTLVDAIDAVAEGKPLGAPWAGYLATLIASGITVEMIRDWLSRWRRKGQLFCLSTKQGVVIFHRPDTRAVIARETTAKTGELHKAMKNMLLASLVFPAGPVFSAACAQAPALVTVLGVEVNAMAGSGAAVVKK